MSNFTIYCKDFELSGSLKIYAEEKLTSLCKYLSANHNLDEIKFNLRMGKTSNSHTQGKIFYAEVSIHTPEKNFGGRIEAEDIYEALDLLKDELTNNITHHKGKARTLERKNEIRFKDQLHESGTQGITN